MTNEWEKEFNEQFCDLQTKSGNGYIKHLDCLVDEIKSFIQSQIDKAVEEERQKNWDKVKEIYDTTDYKKHMDKYETLRNQVVWAVTHYGIVNTEGIIDRLREAVLELDNKIKEVK